MAYETWNKHDVDMVRFAELVLGPSHKKEGGRFCWRCPFHDERTPSFKINAGGHTWKCFAGCGHGDAADLIGKLENLPFPEAARRAAEIAGTGMRFDVGDTMHKIHFKPVAKVEVDHSLTQDEAIAIVVDAEAQLWSKAGVKALGYLRDERGLTDETIKEARLGWTPGVQARRKDGTSYPASGIAIPWFDHGRLMMIKVRKLDGFGSKYKAILVSGGSPEVYPTPQAVKPMLHLVVAEGEFDALLLQQELRDHASVVTIGGASNSASSRVVFASMLAGRKYLATDNDKAGEGVAAKIPGKLVRVAPPAGCKDWTDAYQLGIDLRCWWLPRLGGSEALWSELSTWCWGSNTKYTNHNSTSSEHLSEFNRLIGRPDPI